MRSPEEARIQKLEERVDEYIMHRMQDHDRGELNRHAQ